MGRAGRVGVCWHFPPKCRGLVRKARSHSLGRCGRWGQVSQGNWKAAGGRRETTGRPGSTGQRVGGRGEGGAAKRAAGARPSGRRGEAKPFLGVRAPLLSSRYQELGHRWGQLGRPPAPGRQRHTGDSACWGGPGCCADPGRAGWSAGEGAVAWSHGPSAATPKHAGRPALWKMPQGRRQGPS